MKKLFFLVTLILFSLFLYAQEKVYKVVIRSDWKPYYFTDSSGKPNGYAAELFEQVAKEMGLKYEYVIAKNFQEIIQLLKEDKVDIVPNISISSNRESLLLFTQPTDDFMVNIYKHESSKEIQNLEDIHNKKIGLVSNNICTRLIDQNYTQIEKKFYVDYKALINGLLNKEIDVFCYPKPLIEFENGDHEEIVSLEKSLKEIKRGIGVTKSNFDLLPHLDDAISNLKLTGKLDTLHEKWFQKKKYIELTRSETIFFVLSFFGISFTTLVVLFYYIHKKKWLLTNKMLEDEVEKQTKRYKEQNEILEDLQEKLKNQLNTDPLTNVYNRNFYNQKIEEFIALYKRYKTEFSFLIFDIDDFKKINDNYGHAMGDKVLIELTKAVKAHIRITDYFFRIGGEEFVILFANSSLDDSKTIALKLCHMIANELNVLENRSVTVSIGLTQMYAEDSSETIFKRADNLLYEAKKSGKNQLLFA